MPDVKRLLAAGLVLCAAGCLTTPYQPYASLDGGVNASWQTEDIIVVTSTGDAFTSNIEVEQRAWLKAAEETLNAGKRYMVLMQKDDITTIVPYGSVGDRQREYTDEYYRGRELRSPYEIRQPDEDRAAVPGSQRPAFRFRFYVTQGKPDGLSLGEYYDALTLYNRLGAE